MGKARIHKKANLEILTVIHLQNIQTKRILIIPSNCDILDVYFHFSKSTKRNMGLIIQLVIWLEWRVRIGYIFNELDPYFTESSLLINGNLNKLSLLS